MTAKNLNLIANELFRANAIVYKPPGGKVKGNARIISERSLGATPAHISSILATKKENVEDVSNPDTHSGTWLEVKYTEGYGDEGYTVRLEDKDSGRDLRKDFVSVDESGSPDLKREEVARKAREFLSEIPVRR